MFNKSLSIIIGPMYSGKTSKLFEIYNYNNKNNENQLIIDYTFVKEDLLQITNLYNHDKKYLSCIKFNSRLLKNFNYNNYKYIHINEAQFFPNLIHLIIFSKNILKKNFILCGLDYDYKQEKFGDLLDLVPYADNVYNLTGKCNTENCIHPSKYSHRLINNEEQVLIGITQYEPLCEECYNKKNKKK